MKLKSIVLTLLVICGMKASAASVVTVTYDSNAATLKFDFTGLQAGTYFDAGNNASQGYLNFGTAGAYTGDKLISNSLVDNVGVTVPSTAVNMFICSHESSVVTPLTGLGIGSFTGGGADFKIGGGTITSSTSGVLFSSVNNYFQNFPLTTLDLGSYVGTGGYTVNAVVIPEASSSLIVMLAGGIATLRRRRC